MGLISICAAFSFYKAGIKILLLLYSLTIKLLKDSICLNTIEKEVKLMFFSRNQKQIWINNKVRKRKKSGKKRKGKKRKQALNRKQITNRKQLIVTIFLLALFVSVLHSYFKWKPNGTVQYSYEGDKESTAGNRILEAEKGPCGRPEIIEDFLDKNPYSRSGITLRKVKGVVIHYVENPGSTAKENRDYFNNLQDTHLTKASSHYIVGLDGEIIQCIPQSEISYASNNRNEDTISIECCHPEKNGKFNEKTYDSVVHLTAWICKTYGLSSKNVIRHYDVTGKMCPKYYVKHENAWKDFCNKVQECLEKD